MQYPAPRHHARPFLSRLPLAWALVLVAALGGATAASVPWSRHAPRAAAIHVARPCGDEAALRTVVGIVCVHGDDPAFRTTAVATTRSGGGAYRLPIPCHGDGRSGNRLAVYYAYIAGHPNRIVTARAQIRAAIERANYLVYRSARQMHGGRWLRVLTRATCRPIVRALRLPRAAADSFGATVEAAQTAGLRAANRKYVLFVDTDNLCGVATLRYDDRRGPENANNAGPSWARVDRVCWDGPAVTHEIFHMLGAVQTTAPHFDDTGHCTDDRDLMCYQNKGGKRVRIRCTALIDDDRLDCAKDDYFNIAPRSGSYLALHWNTARSSFLYGGGPAQPVPPGAIPAIDSVMVTLATARVRWSAPVGSRVTSYDVTKNGSIVWHGTATEWEDPNALAVPGTYRVRAVNAAAAGPWSATVTAALPAPPAPDTVTATSATSVSWTADSSLVSTFRVYGVSDDGTEHYVGSWPATARSATDPTDGFLRTWQRYRVCAYNATAMACRDQSS
jgi:hypothetical protein